jgi:hypothetical protein
MLNIYKEPVDTVEKSKETTLVQEIEPEETPVE